MSSILHLIKHDVGRAVAQEGDGTRFFDLLDRLLINQTYFDWLRDRILDDTRYPYDGILSSGKFGWAFSMYAAYRPVLPPVYNFPGNLKHEELHDPLIDPSFSGKRFVYIDNSIYKGRTLGQINRYVKDYDGTIEAAYILYDGSRPPHQATRIVNPFHYVYRWHDGGFRV